MSLNKGREYLYWKSESRLGFLRGGICPRQAKTQETDVLYHLFSVSRRHSVDVEVRFTKVVVVYSRTPNGLRIQIGYQIEAFFHDRQGAMRHLIIPPRTFKDSSTCGIPIFSHFHSRKGFA